MNRLKIERVGRRGQWVAGPGSRHVDAISSYVEILPLRPNTADERTDTSRAGKGHKLNICIVENRRKIDPFVFFFFFWILKGKLRRDKCQTRARGRITCNRSW